MGWGQGQQLRYVSWTFNIRIDGFMRESCRYCRCSDRVMCVNALHELRSRVIAAGIVFRMVLNTL